MFVFPATLLSPRLTFLMTNMNDPYDAILVISFGGPEKREDVMPFLENVLRGRNVPRERMLEVAEHYYHYDGVSPINQQTRDLLAVFEPALREQDIQLPVYWGNRNWHPMLTDTLRQMQQDGVKRALGLVMSAYSSYSGCRQYREDVMRSQETLCSEQDTDTAADSEPAPGVDKIRVWYNHPLWIEVNADTVAKAIAELPADQQSTARIAFTAHSIPMSMANSSHYEKQLQETCRLIAEHLQISDDRWQLVYQSRSGRPQDPWLEPDICDHIGHLHNDGVPAVVVAPVGFLSDHMEVLFDLDEEAKTAAARHNMGFARAGTAGTDPRFVQMLKELVAERLSPQREKRAIGQFGPNHDVCPLDCCPAPQRPKR